MAAVVGGVPRGLGGGETGKSDTDEGTGVADFTSAAAAEEE